MSDHPELYYWVYLLPVCLFAFWFIQYDNEKLKAKKVPIHVIAAILTYFLLWQMGLFRLLIYPLLAGVFVFFLAAIVRAKNSSKLVAAAILCSFVVTYFVAHFQRRERGAYWELSKEKYQREVDHSFSWIANAAKENRFTREQLLHYMRSKQKSVRDNARSIARLTGLQETDTEDAKSFYESLQEIDPELAEDYFDNIPFDLQREIYDGEFPPPREERLKLHRSDSQPTEER